MTAARFEAANPWTSQVKALPTAEAAAEAALVRRAFALPDIVRPAGFGWDTQEWTQCADAFTATTAGAGALLSAVMATQGQNPSCLALALLAAIGVIGQSLLSRRRRRSFA